MSLKNVLQALTPLNHMGKLKIPMHTQRVSTKEETYMGEAKSQHKPMFQSSSQQVLNTFLMCSPTSYHQHLIVPLSHFFAQCYPLGTYIGGLILIINMPFYVWNQQFYVGKFPKLLNFFFMMGQSKWFSKNKLSLKGTPQLINMDHNNITYIINIHSLTIVG